MTGIHIIKIFSVKGAIPIQSQLSHHLQINLSVIYKGFVMVSLIECIHLSLYKVLVLETMVLVVFCILFFFCFFFFLCCSILVYIILIVCMNIDFFNKCNVRKLTLTFSLSNIGTYEQYAYYISWEPK